MKLKYYVILGNIISTLIIILGVGYAVNKMLIVKSEVYFIIGVTIVAALVGSIVSLIMLTKVFTSLEQLKKFIGNIPNKKFEKIEGINNPSEFKELAEAFNEMSEELETTFDSLAQSEQEKDSMIAQLTHDIKTPITSIQATVEGMIDGVIAEQERLYYLKTINRQTNRLNKLVEQLNYLTLNKEQKLVVEKETVFLDKMLIDILSEFQLKLDKENRDVEIAIEPPSAKIKTNNYKLSRIILNLVSNALKYSNEGTKLKITAKLEQSTLEIKVHDEGMGIRKEEIDNIFKRLYRVETSRNMTTGGHGLGLYIARELATQLNGTLDVESEYGKGSIFTLRIKDVEVVD